MGKFVKFTFPFKLILHIHIPLTPAADMLLNKFIEFIKWNGAVGLPAASVIQPGNSVFGVSRRTLCGDTGTQGGGGHPVEC